MSTTGCRLLLGQLDLMAQTYLLKQSQRGCVSIAHATALVLIKINPQVVVNINLEYSSWARSLFRRMGLVKREKTSLKVEIPDAARNKPEFLLYYIEVKITHTLVLNLDEILLNYIPLSKETIAKCSFWSVTIKASDDKRMIARIFAITLSETFLPMQLIYGRKISQGLLFPKQFSLRAFHKHFSNTGESLKFLCEIVILYFNDKKSK